MSSAETESTSHRLRTPITSIVQKILHCNRIHINNEITHVAFDIDVMIFVTHNAKFHVCLFTKLLHQPQLHNGELLVNNRMCIQHVVALKVIKISVNISLKLTFSLYIKCTVNMITN